MRKIKAMEKDCMLNVVSLQPDHRKDQKLTEFCKATLKDRYLYQDENYQDMFLRVVKTYSDDDMHAARMYDYISNLWFMPATPILSNGGTKRGLPISCFINEVDDSLEGIANIWNENVWLASKGGGIGSYWGNIRSIGEEVGRNGKTSGIIPFIKVMDSQTLAISQGSLRRGSAAVYLDIAHPEIEEFIDIRRPTGGDYNRKSLNLHHAVIITDDFMNAVASDKDWELKSPDTKKVISVVSARALWIKILTTRIETGEPYILNIDHVNNNLPLVQQKLGLKVKTSNLCSEITLPTGLDHLGNVRTAVCCLGSVNLVYFEEWKEKSLFISDIMRFLDNVLSDFIANAPDSMNNAKYSAMRERSVGLGVMGLHSFFQKNLIPFESTMAKVWNKNIFSFLKEQTDIASKELAKEKGACPDAQDAGLMERFSNSMSIAPTASISIICGSISPGIDPYSANSYTHKTLTGSVAVKNQFLEELLESKGCNTDEIWSSITTHEGSVQHLSCLDEHEKEIFKTAFEIDQIWVVDLAGDRASFISQSQSVNLFLHSDIHKQYLHKVHFLAWKKGVKSLYYCRSTSIQRAEKVSHKVKNIMVGDGSATIGSEARKNNNDYDECLSCQ